MVSFIALYRVSSAAPKHEEPPMRMSILRSAALLLLSAGILLQPLTHGARCAENEGARPLVYILHSYEPDNPCGQPQHRGVIAGLQAAGFYDRDNIRIHTHYMDTRETNNTPELEAAAAEKAYAEVNLLRPALLVTLDDAAFAGVGLRFAGQAGTPAVVFCGLNGLPEDYNLNRPFFATRQRPGGNITGIYEKLHIAAALKVNVEIMQRAGEVVVITDTTPLGRSIRRQIEQELADTGGWRQIDAIGWEDYQRIIHNAGQDEKVTAIYPAALLLRSADGQTRTAPEIFRWTRQNGRKPEIPINFSFCKMGLFGGAAVDFFAMGRQAGGQAARILRGTPAGEIPIEDAGRFALAFNISRARELGINIPEDILLAADEIVNDEQ